MSSSNVRKDQQFCCAAGDSTVWQVLAVSPDPSGIPHARLCNVERPYEFRTLTCSLLDDPRHYRLLSDVSDANLAPQTIRAKLPRRRTPRLSPAA
jgi:hypothetical protein